MQTIHHTNGHIGWLYGTPAGLLEYRAIPGRSGVQHAVIHHAFGCDATRCGDACDAETTPGQEIALAVNIDGEQAIWDALAAIAVERDLGDVPQPASEPTHEHRQFRAALIAEGHRTAHPDHYA
ncbi:hypothetical protein ABT336_12050 [Micromonospora sp. NPDC000207]|uniref:hypothetical protein n=1 Tax=Micromonospora sp. NPDC000207 TaxID=3154246 RepID=UPI003320BF7F